MVDPISIITLVELCLKTGKKLWDLCSSFKNARVDIAKQILRVQNYWMRANLQLETVKNIAHELHEDHRKIIYETIDMLNGRLRAVEMKIESAMKKERNGGEAQVSRVRYMVSRRSIDISVDELERWQNMFDPSWYLAISRVGSQVENELSEWKQSPFEDCRVAISSAESLRSALRISSNAEVHREKVLLPEAFLETLGTLDIPLSSAQLGTREDKGQMLIIEKVQPLPGLNANDLDKNCRDLARRLIRSNPLEFGLLSCKGYMKHRPQHLNRAYGESFTLLFRVPDGFSQPRTLRSRLMELKPTESLTDRFRLANELARAVSCVHSFGFVHKNIRPETILLLTNTESLSESAFLIGFDSFRMISGKTLRKGELAWERCLYQHPDRIGSSVSEDYIMHHDIYSLGVCLLEIGLWEPLVTYEDTGMPLPRNGTHSPAVRASFLQGGGDSYYFKNQLLSLARTELQQRMGTRYSEVVVTCLTCLDPENDDFGDETEFQDEDGIEVGVRYIEKVTMRLNSLCV
ncbi:hypothetical protein PMG11_01289 [Penicillium brasilianum]|uniref:Protein kinase domain-containing protein n=1 Tax=Penicillium brasilianum TaxID=104259 RepID=A0A0F7THL9_PENBI|nr:hypothetical protein PMG11_01289 [Penicillium brasilianum]